MSCFFLSLFIKRIHYARVSFVPHFLTLLFPNVVIYMHYSVSWIDPTDLATNVNDILYDNPVIEGGIVIHTGTRSRGAKGRSW